MPRVAIVLWTGHPPWAQAAPGHCPPGLQQGAFSWGMAHGYLRYPPHPPDLPPEGCFVFATAGRVAGQQKDHLIQPCLIIYSLLMLSEWRVNVHKSLAETGHDQSLLWILARPGAPVGVQVRKRTLQPGLDACTLTPNNIIRIVHLYTALWKAAANHSAALPSSQQRLREIDVKSPPLRTCDWKQPLTSCTCRGFQDYSRTLDMYSCKLQSLPSAHFLCTYSTSRRLAGQVAHKGFSVRLPA